MKGSLQTTFMSIKKYIAICVHVIGYRYVADSTNRTSPSKSYGSNTIELKPKYDTLESIGVGGESKSCKFKSSVAEIDNKKPPITGSWLY